MLKLSIANDSPLMPSQILTVSGCGEFESSKADVVKSLVVDAVRLVCVLDELVHGQGGSS